MINISRRRWHHHGISSVALSIDNHLYQQPRARRKAASCGGA